MPSLSTGSRKPRSVADGPAPWIFPTFLFFLSISFAGQAGATDPFQKLPQIQEWNSGSSSGTVAPLSETSPGSTSTCIYFENFEDSTHGWTAFDRFGGTVYWTRTTFSGRSVWWCGVDDPCFAAGSGYGPFWYQKLSKSFALPSAPITLSLVHQYDVETNYDFAYVDVSTDGGVTFTNEASFTGNSGGFVTDAVDLSAYAQSTVVIRLRFASDGAYDDSDGLFPTDGAWRVDEVTVSGHPADTFDSGGDGWTASAGDLFRFQEGTPEYRLEQHPPTAGLPEDFCNSWVVYDPGTSLVPFIAPPDVDTPVYSIPIIGIESPPIVLPDSAAGYEMSVAVFDDMPLWNLIFFGFDIVSTGSDGCERAENLGFVYFFPGATDWQTFDPDITSLVQPGATSIKIRLWYTDYSRLFVEDWTGNHGMGPYFDNVCVVAHQTDQPYVDCSTIPRDCTGAGQTVSLEGTVEGSSSSSSSAGLSTMSLSPTSLSGPLAGVTVDVMDGLGQFHTTTTDADGRYVFPSLPVSNNHIELTVVAPLGTVITSPPGGTSFFALLGDAVVSFDAESSGQLSGSGAGSRGLGYWKHQTRSHLFGKGTAQEDLDDMSLNFPRLIFDHFYDAGLGEIQIEGVTYQNAPGPVPMDLDALNETLWTRNGTREERAKQHYMALLLNVASGRVATYDTVSVDGATASQAIQHMRDLILSGDPEDHDAAKNIGEAVNSNILVGPGIIPLNLSQIYYSPPARLNAAPNPFTDATSIAFRTNTAGPVRAEVFDIQGRKVRTLLNRTRLAGDHTVMWDGLDDGRRSAGNGIYFIRVATPDFVRTSKVHLLER